MARILLIDDDDLVRSALSRILVHYGHTVIEASDGDVGLKLFPKIDVDLVITDLIMPEKCGFEVIKDLRKYFSRVKLIVISGSARGSTKNYLNMAMYLGADRVLEKPFVSEELNVMIEELLPSQGTGTDK
jgi:DNA-binding response OmpR family regulator